MNKKEISNAISHISPKYIQEAENYSIYNRHISKKKIAENNKPISKKKNSINNKYFSKKRNFTSNRYIIRKKNSVKKILTYAAVFAICMMLLTQATNVQAVYRILYFLSPEITQALKPVRISCEDQDIRMEVLSAYIHGNEAEVYISMQDLTGEHIDDTIDLFDSYSINRPFSSQASCNKISYNPDTCTATFFIHFTELENGKSSRKKIEGDKITFTVNGFLSHKQEYHATIPMDLSTANLEPQTQTNINFRGYGGYIEKIINDNDHFAPASESISFASQTEKIPTLDYLAPLSDALCTPTPGVTITAIGFINRKLHIQTYYENIHETDNHGFLSLIDTDGNKVAAEVSISFWDAQRCGSYDETIFLISPDEISNYTLYGDFWTCSSLTYGNWQVTFPLEAEEETNPITGHENTVPNTTANH